MSSRLLALAFVVFVFLLSSCGGGNLVGEINEDTRVTDGVIPAGETLLVRNGAKVIVQGEMVINGIIVAESGPINFVVEEGGRLVINGELSAVMDYAEDGSNLGSGGIYILAQGDLEFSSTARLQTNGQVIITDDPADLTRDPVEIAAETDSASGDLSTLVPLPPDDPAFENEASFLPRPKAGTFLPSSQNLPKKIISGIWIAIGFPGDQQIILISFESSVDLVFENFEVIPPQAQNGENGEDGKKGMRMNIYSAGSVKTNFAIFNLANGGDGSRKGAICDIAEAGSGGESGNMRITAETGIIVRDTIINPGRGGNGGNATAECDQPGGDAIEAVGGNGANNTKKLLVRGNVDIERLTIGPLIAGDGGDALAVGADGADGEKCKPGQNGGYASTNTDIFVGGGNGGYASLEVGFVDVPEGNARDFTVSEVKGGDGGDAKATGGNGGNGSPGGNGGEAWALAGWGGTASGGNPNRGGDGGDAEANGGNGGNGSPPGKGGAATAIAGKKGLASGGNPNTDGEDGNSKATPGLDGKNTGAKTCAIDAYEAGDWDLALQLFDQAVQENPDDAEVFIRRGNLLFDMELYDEALEDFLRALELDPDSEIAYYDAGIALFQLGQYDESREACREATHINPDYDLAWYCRALAEEQLGLLDSALDSYITFLELHPEDDEFRAYANQRVAALRGGGETSGGITISGSYAHTQPGVQSEVYLDILGPAGATAQFTLSGPGVIGSSSQSGTIGDDGRLRLTWTINQFGPYTASGTVNGQTFSVTINVQ